MTLDATRTVPGFDDLWETEARRGRVLVVSEQFDIWNKNMY